MVKILGKMVDFVIAQAIKAKRIFPTIKSTAESEAKIKTKIFLLSFHRMTIRIESGMSINKNINHSKRFSACLFMTAIIIKVKRMTKTKAVIASRKWNNLAFLISE